MTREHPLFDDVLDTLVTYMQDDLDVEISDVGLFKNDVDCIELDDDFKEVRLRMKHKLEQVYP
ncbi:hypothetical protein [Snodgrassella sp. CFCC 13594]|uniref:hypothetical protein n=1 Tax=Snodgrassella sp. CFCC 13594 TaxID=1775559 RepID=UPI000AF490F3|nr:hypothetical protein [Snodgrassella sp. CFCC 13594]